MDSELDMASKLFIYVNYIVIVAAIFFLAKLYIRIMAYLKLKIQYYKKQLED